MTYPIQIDGEQIYHILQEIKKLNKIEQKTIYYYLCDKLGIKLGNNDMSDKQ